MAIDRQPLEDMLEREFPAPAGVNRIDWQRKIADVADQIDALVLDLECGYCGN